MTTPAFTAKEERTREAFLALMWAMSYPGRVHTLPTPENNTLAAFETIGDTLLDLEVSYYTPDAALHQAFQRTTSRLFEPADAEYLFFSSVGDEHIAQIAQAQIGTMLYPDTGATLVLGCTFEGTPITLTGPGIQGSTRIAVGALPSAVWEWREKVRRFPLGWDIILVSGNQVIGLPRSTGIEIG
jgi:alpha-D-ribose 1-methylphosphonate 5-triphosphate synthase subunit PhnH